MTGPVLPTSAAVCAPMRRIAADCRNTGSTVANRAIAAASHHTGAGCASASNGRTAVK